MERTTIWIISSLTSQSLSSPVTLHWRRTRQYSLVCFTSSFRTRSPAFQGAITEEGTIQNNISGSDTPSTKGRVDNNFLGKHNEPFPKGQILKKLKGLSGCCLESISLLAEIIVVLPPACWCPGWLESRRGPAQVRCNADLLSWPPEYISLLHWHRGPLSVNQSVHK